MKKVLSFILSALMILCSVFTALPVSAATDPIIVVAGSDFQDKTSNVAGQEKLNSFFTAMKNNGITDIDGFLFAGDYDYSTYNDVRRTKGGMNYIKDAVSTLSPEHSVYIQGNHDASPAECGMSASGANDHPNGHYGVFVIHEDDFMWQTQNEAVVKNTASNLTAYLNAKLSAGYKKPIFVISHLPIHYNYRTKRNGDGMYGNYIFDVLNEAGKKGLNIIFMYGHNHSTGWDNFLGGASIFLTKGDKLNIPQASTTNFKEETLNFTYMNAGYVAYYTEGNTTDESTLLTMTVFEITDTKVKISRYTRSGEAQYLKEAGYKTPLYETEFNANTKTYTSPQSVTLSAVSDKTPITEAAPEPPKYLSGRNYKKVTSVSELKDGGKYLFIHQNGYVMLPSSVTKTKESDGSTRTGFDIVSASGMSGDIIAGDHGSKEWTLKRSGSGWLLSANGKYASFKASGERYEGKLEANGTVLSIGGTVDAFTVYSGTVGLNYNSRGLINPYEYGGAGYEKFSIYELVGYKVEVVNGTSSAEGIALPGAKITLTASDAPQGKVFDKWTVNAGGITVDSSGTFTMPEAEVKITATYKNVSASSSTPEISSTPEESSVPEQSSDNVVTSDVTSTEGSDNIPNASTSPTVQTSEGGIDDGEDKNDGLIIAIAIVAVATVAAIVVIVVAKKKKR